MIIVKSRRTISYWFGPSGVKVGSSSQNVLNLILKSTRFVPFVANLTHFGTEFASLVGLLLFVWEKGRKMTLADGTNKTHQIHFRFLTELLTVGKRSQAGVLYSASNYARFGLQLCEICTKMYNLTI